MRGVFAYLTGELGRSDLGGFGQAGAATTLAHGVLGMALGAHLGAAWGIAAYLVKECALDLPYAIRRRDWRLLLATSVDTLLIDAVAVWQGIIGNIDGLLIMGATSLVAGLIRNTRGSTNAGS